MNILEFHNVTRAFRHGINVLDDVSFSLAPGEVVGLLGRNGAGKTTLIRSAMGMIRPQAGSVTVFGHDPAHDAVSVKRRLAESGTAILFSSHHMNDVERLGRRVVMLQRGQVFIDTGLDKLREDYCRAIIPGGNGTTPASLQNLEGFMSARGRGGALHAVFRLDPERAAAIVEQGLRTRNVVCKRLPLEELFIELVGGTI